MTVKGCRTLAFSTGRQLLQCMLVNAFDALPQEGVRVSRVTVWPLVWIGGWARSLILTGWERAKIVNAHCCGVTIDCSQGLCSAC
jgi:hypothetical protein